jgi:hypothetical protein
MKMPPLRGEEEKIIIPLIDYDHKDLSFELGDFILTGNDPQKSEIIGNFRKVAYGKPVLFLENSVVCIIGITNCFMF